MLDQHHYSFTSHLMQLKPATSTNTLPSNPTTPLLRQKAHNLRNFLWSRNPILNKRRILLRLNQRLIHLMQHLRLRRTRIHRIHGRAIFAQLCGPTSRPTLQSSLGRTVGRRSGKSGTSSNGRDVDDASWSPQVWEDCLEHE